MNPLISIIVSTYNRERLIAETLHSVLAQEYENWECIVVDDGSWENTAAVVEEYILKDKRFRFYNRPETKTKGASACRNYGLEMAKGELIQFLDDDDLMDEFKLEKQVEVYSGGNDILTCKWGWFSNSADLNGKFKNRYRSYKNFKSGAALLDSFGLYNEFFPLHVFLTPRDLIQKAGSWNEELGNNDDAEFFARMLMAASSVNFVPEAKVYYRDNSPENLSALNSEKKVESLIASWKLIERHLENNKRSLMYVRNAKYHLYNLLEKIHPRVVKEEKAFFSDKKSYQTEIRQKFDWLLSKLY